MTRHPVDLDLLTAPPAERHDRLLAAFDALEPGDALVFASDHDAHPLLYRLEVERTGHFNWSPLEEGTRVWRVRVDRLGPSERRARGVMEYLAWDHDRLDELVAEVTAAARPGKWRDAAKRFAEFRHGLLRHIRMEEDLLFPLFEKRTGLPRDEGPTAVMREEHGEIQALLGEIGKIVERGSEGHADESRRALERPLRALLDLLVEHNLKEEQVLYPSLDHMLSEDERDALVRKMMAVRL